MKQIALTKVQLRLLNTQLQQFQQGFSISEIRSLDRVARVFNKVLAEFNNGIEELQEKKDTEGITKYVEEHGIDKVDVILEDQDFDFLNVLWNRMGGLSGTDTAREVIIAIDDAIRAADAKVFTSN